MHDPDGNVRPRQICAYSRVVSHEHHDKTEGVKLGWLLHQVSEAVCVQLIEDECYYRSIMTYLRAIVPPAELSNTYIPW